MLLVPNLGEVASDLQQHALVRRNLPRASLLDALVKVVDRGAQWLGLEKYAPAFRDNDIDAQQRIPAESSNRRQQPAAVADRSDAEADQILDCQLG